MTVDVGFGLKVTACCRDCGADVANPLELRGRATSTLADASDQALVNVDVPGACEGCGGGRIAVRTTFSVEGGS